MAIKGGSPLEWEILRTFADPDPISAPRTAGAANNLSILAIQAMMAMESVQRYGGLPKKKNNAYGKPGCDLRELWYLQ
ncbi:MAG: hypothetical protein WBM17_10280 [Anaerolineales bacterium]